MQSRCAHVHSKLDHACTTAVALAQLALYSGDRVGLLAYGQGIQQRLLPGRGAAHLRQFIESLAQVRAESGEADHLRATATLNRLQPRRSLILWVTDLAETAMRPEVIDGAVQLLRRHVLLFVAMAQPEVESIAQARPKNVEQMFRAAAAQEMAGRRELLLARLHEQGALTLDLNPEALTSSVLNQYLIGEGTGDGVAEVSAAFLPPPESRAPAASSEKIVTVNRAHTFCPPADSGAGASRAWWFSPVRLLLPRAGAQPHLRHQSVLRQRNRPSNQR